MDFSSLPEAQKQQLQQLQQQFEEHQRQQQQQQQQAAQAAQQQQIQQQQIHQQQQQQQQQIQEYAASQPYDPTQVQSYDQSYYSYYQSQDPQQQHQQQHQQYAYYQADYGNAYQQHPQQQVQQPQQQNSQIESASVYPPPGVSNESHPQIVGSGGGAPAVQVQPQNVESGGGATAAQVQHQDAYYPQQVAAPAAAPPQAGDQQVVAPVGPSEMNPAAGPSGLNAAAAAAVAALSQLTQFAGTMDAAERAMAELQGLQWHRGGGGPGGYGPMMGPGPYMGPELMHPPVGRFPFRGGGRRGGRPFRGGRAPKSGGSGSPSHGRGRGRGRGGPKRFPPHGASSSSNPEPDSESKVEEEEEAAVPSADNHETPVQGPRPPQAIRCELCKIECNSLEILEQHNNGKKHKKNLQMSGYPVPEIQKPVSDPNAGVTLPPENVNQGDNLPSEAVNGENKVEIDQKNGEVGEPELPEEQSTVQEMKPSVNRFDNQRRGVKRKMRGGRGGKRVKSFDPPRRAAEPPKPKIVVPIVCDLCNVKCDTQEVFNIHLSGKKHISKLKRYEGHHAMYGPVGLQALYPPNPIAQTSYPQGPQQAYYGPQVQYPPPEAYMPPQAHYAAPAETGFQQSHNPQVS